MRTWSISSILLLVAVIAFALAAIGLKVDVSLIAVGLAFFAAAFLVGGMTGGAGPRL
jgi:energy-coupling factor transporter transmembrane protein EcfT